MFTSRIRSRLGWIGAGLALFVLGTVGGASWLCVDPAVAQSGSALRDDLPAGVFPDSLPETTPGSSVHTEVPDKTRRDFHSDCFASGCHAQLRELPWLHAPFAVKGCQACHVLNGPAGLHKFKPTQPLEEICSSCHLPREPKAVRHEPFAKSQCYTCHNPHGGPNKLFHQESSLALLCASCHDGKEHDGKVVSAGPRAVAFPHEPAADGDCVGCHFSHQSDYEDLLVRETKRDLCLGCHRKMIPMASAFDGQADGFQLPETLPVGQTFDVKRLSRVGDIPDPRSPDSLCYYVTGPLKNVDLPRSTQADDLASTTHLVLVHKPVISDCGACHASHGSAHKGMVKEEQKKLCLSCHKEIAERLPAARSHHEKAMAEGGCDLCHAGHGGLFGDLLREPARKTCLSCHDKPIQMPGGREVADIQAQIHGAQAIHEPVREDCGACHFMHASPEPKLLRGRYVEDNYVQYTAETYGLCLSCHNDDYVEDEFTTVTKFRDGARNLHFLHVHDERGRSCVNCHDSHASPRASLISETIRFGPNKWPMPIDYVKTTTGGSCSAGCHRKLAYDREHPVNPENPSSEEWSASQ